MHLRDCVLSLALVASVGLAAQAQIFQPDSAVAGSEFSGSYDIGNAIDGSGLPPGFDATSVHATYAANNHWTTRAGALAAGNAWATFSFDEPVTIGTFLMWNHLSNGVASDPGYAITRFTLELMDSDSNVLHSLVDVTAVPNVHTAQSFVMPITGGVSSVKLTILANNGSPNYTGLAEVAFSAVPAPGALALLGIGAIVSRRRR